MNEKINELAEQLRQEIMKETNSITSSVAVYMNYQGCKFEINQRTPDSLERDGISMRNLKGEWI